MEHMVEMFSFKDALHDHISIGHREGCIACAQTQADMALSRKALASQPEVAPNQLAHVA